MSAAEILPIQEALALHMPEHESALTQSADFFLEQRPHLQLVDKNYRPTPPRILDVLLERPGYDQGPSPTNIIGLKEYMKGLLDGQDDRYYRNKMAADYGQHYRGELDVDTEDLTYDQHSNLVLAKLYLSSLSSLGELGMFIETNRWMGHKSSAAETAKVKYLTARKVYQDDVDS